MEQKTYLDSREIERIVETHSDMLLRIAINRVRSIAEAEDIVQAVYLYYYEGLPVKAIADLLNEPTGTITSRLSRARKRLKLLLKGDEHGTVSIRV